MNNIKSFVCRYRKLKKLKQIIFNKYFNFFNISYKEKKINFINIFNNKLPIIIDIGFGRGNNIINFAMNNTNYNFIGIEVYIPGIINCLQKIKKNKIKNLKLIYYDAFYVLKNMFPNYSIELIQLYFPDPWPKKKHKKRRLLKIDFLKIIFFKLKNNGLLYIITDCLDYKNSIISNIKNINNINNKFIILKSNQYQNIYKNFNLNLLKTRFLNQAKKKKRNIYCIEYKKILLIK
ncbi:tRNA (guanosine(46)-N7)-methyltransferase TrmB [Enterobacteriaceae endosymbiont of Donacia bicoloricornis]|uniref:tRNA (guanosine(46)-N7)-methyltransferase TrmB n=1 Tax=Enterobacteriaceae endosymbiont of Donacia bicoloricornis TaxID=2675772 RepID=UPI001448B8C5|nr:tRNA (guanosine(46)-N7)-methyltransferase TrmB [Enterobacteriaceae endosymbiont of Donacia bicoloricornis]QJC37801.1 tRNA (guanosine(46)-N7)-methyltransferase TrmB [Enterobacteriaceae endosymbiont of Donacia bicoloricornis]